MTSSAGTTTCQPADVVNVAEAIRREIPGVGRHKLNRLAYYAAGHYIAECGKPLFKQRIAAWDDGPVVPALWRDYNENTSHLPLRERLTGDWQKLSNTQWCYVSIACSRYGSLSTVDLNLLTRAETPWKLANASRKPGMSTWILDEWLTEYFTGDGHWSAGSEQLPMDQATVEKWIDDHDDADTVAKRHYNADGKPRPESVDATPIYLEGRAAGVHSLLERLDPGFRRRPKVTRVVWTSERTPQVVVCVDGDRLTVTREGEQAGRHETTLDDPDLFAKLAAIVEGAGDWPGAEPYSVQRQ